MRSEAGSRSRGSLAPLAPVVWAVPTLVMIHGLTRLLVGLGELILGR